MFLAFVTSWGISRANAFPESDDPYLSVCRRTFFLAFVGVGRTDYGALAVHDDDALHVLVGLHAVEGFLHFRHLRYILKHYSPRHLIQIV